MVIIIVGGLWLLFFSSKPQSAMEMIIGSKRDMLTNQTGVDPLAQPFKVEFDGWLNKTKPE